MGTLPITMVAGSHYALYEACYQQVDPSNEGRVWASVAAKFLKTSGLSDEVLSKVWDLSDANGKGYLFKSEFFVALKLVALIQAGKEAISSNLSLDIPPPRMMFNSSSSHANVNSEYKAPVVSNWAMKPEEKFKYDQLFDSLDSSKGVVSGSEVKKLLMDSKLPVDALGKIWDLADMDKDGALDRHEFSIAMHLVYKALENYAIPSHLPPELFRTETKKEETRLVSPTPMLSTLSNGIPVTSAAAVEAATTTTIKNILPVSALSSTATATPPVTPSMQSFSNSIVAHSTTSTMYSTGLLPITASSTTLFTNTSSSPFTPLVSSPSISPVTTSPPLFWSLPSSLCTASAAAITVAVVTTDSHTTRPYSVSSPSCEYMTKTVTSITLPKPRIGSLSSTGLSSPSDLTAVTFSANNLCSSYEEGWVISSEEKIKFDNLFEQADEDRDGFVSGHEIKDTFLKSGVAQSVLAHIWNLCDTEEQGKLNKDQFALALWLISRKLKGIDPPAKLTHEMVPPSIRNSFPNDSSSSLNDVVVFNSPDVDRLTAEIDDLAKEKLILETNITQREADIRIKSSELRSLQNELDALVATLKQLENQKGEALKRISDLKMQVNKLRQQVEEQERQLKCQEAELNKRKEEIKNIKVEETNLKWEREILRKQTDDVTKSSVGNLKIIGEMRVKMTELEDFQTQLNAAISYLDSVLDSKNVACLSEVFLNMEPKFENESFIFLCEQISKMTNSGSVNVAEIVDTFPNTIQARSSVENEVDVKNDSAKNGQVDPFVQQDPFGSIHGESIANQTSNALYVGGVDSFTSLNNTDNILRKADPFADNVTSKVKILAQQRTTDTTSSKDDIAVVDPFGCDPFAILHAPAKPSSIVSDNTHLTSSTPSSTATSMPSRSESPSPALPPKKCKQPPPRPAPPRPAPPAVPSGFDADTDFADFSNFSRKVFGDATTAIIGSTIAKNGTNIMCNRDTIPLKSSDTDVDPFRDYRYDDPFEMVVNVDNVNQKNADVVRVLSSDFTSKIPRGASAPPLMDAFEPSFFKSSSSISGGNNSLLTLSKSISGLTTKSISSSDLGLLSENQQLAWAAANSVKTEKERRKRAEQEKADYKLAIKLSKAEGRKKSFKSKILLS